MSNYEIKGLREDDTITASSFEEAKRKLRAYYSLNRLYIWGPFNTDQGEGWSVYHTLSEMNEDKATGGGRGAYVPMIERIDREVQS